jgi:predicted esterase
MRATLLWLITTVACNHAAPGGQPTVDAEPEPEPADAAADPAPVAKRPAIPEPTGPCPPIVDGDVEVAPAGIPARRVRLALDPAATPPIAAAPLVLYWHATGSNPREPELAFNTALAPFTAAGGIVAAPASDPLAGLFEWYTVNGSPRQDDALIADEVVGCLVRAGRVDPLRIHSIGMSAGGLETTVLGFTRSTYLASVVTFSGGLAPILDPVTADPDNRFAALIFDGGPTDFVFGVDFEAASERYRDRLVAEGHFAARCNHRGGHQIPLDAAAGVLAFFAANPYGAWPSPELPSTVPDYCQE